MHVRRALPSDAPDIARVLAAAFAPHELAYTPAAYAATTPGADTIRARFPDGLMWVALDGDRVVGTVGAVPRDGEVYLRSMAVDPTARGRGVGARVVAAVEEYAAARRSTRVVLSTTPFLDAAIALYEKGGFVRTGKPPHALHGTALVTMAKPIG